MLSSSMCVSMMSVVSVSTTKGAVTADGSPAPYRRLLLPKAIGIQRREANECRRLTDSTLSATEESGVSGSVSLRSSGSRSFFDTCALSETTEREGSREESEEKGGRRQRSQAITVRSSSFSTVTFSSSCLI